MIHIDPDVFTFQEDLDYSKETFVVTGAQGSGAVVKALEKAAGRFMLVDETGVEHPDYQSLESATEAADLYTPNWVAEPKITDRGVEMYVDCKGSIADPMAEKLREILREELEATGVDGRVSAATSEE